MGPRYILFRVWYEFQRKSGLLKSRFPVLKPVPEKLPGKTEWLNSSGRFFFGSRNELYFPKNPSANLDKTYRDCFEGRFLFFHSTIFDLGQHDGWLTNPSNGYRYDIGKHWTEVSDFSKEAGDIKYVWEKARFSWLLSIVRYDYHFEKDNGDWVFSQLEDFIDKNPVNQGPQYKCSQEISIRLLNWYFALYFYRDSIHLTEERFSKIMASVYWQVHHVFQNIHFSRIAVRNNHALTESLVLYVSGLLFPGIASFQKWKGKGKKWFEQEIAYQVYEDGTFLQFSMNYHRVVVQLLTWAIRLSENNGEKLHPVVYDRAEKSLQFLRSCMDEDTGILPNYGMNDGALFFPLNDHAFRDYRPQLQALECVLNKEVSGEKVWEDCYWTGIQAGSISNNHHRQKVLNSFNKGGYYPVKEKDSLTFIRCGSHKDRPHQADNLHLDIWVRGKNILRDAGSYIYNTGEKWTHYFNGSEGHNVVMLNGEDQMLKGGRFIWYLWTQSRQATLEENQDAYLFMGSIKAFRQLGPGIYHHRKVEKKKGAFEWLIRDEITGVKKGRMRQIWHPNPACAELIKFVASDATGNALQPVIEEGWYSGLYGQKELSGQVSFYSDTLIIETSIQYRG